MVGVKCPPGSVCQVVWCAVFSPEGPEPGAAELLPETDDDAGHPQGHDDRQVDHLVTGGNKKYNLNRQK